MLVDIIAIIFVLIGVLGTLLPGIPGTPAVFLVILIHSWANDFIVLVPRNIIFLLLLMLLAQAVEYLASFLSAKYYGASKAGLIGALLGSILGIIFLGPLGLFVGPLIGAIVLELLAGKRFKEACKVGLGTVVGSLGGSLFSFLVAIAMATFFIINLVTG